MNRIKAINVTTRTLGAALILGLWSSGIQADALAWHVDIAKLDWDQAKNVTQHVNWDFDPHWSPDGKQFVFHSNRPPSPTGVTQIYKVNADGSDPIALTHTQQGNYGAAWSPDNNKIAFTSNRDGNPELYLMNPDGSEQQNISNNPDSYDGGGEWSPDGRYLAFFTGHERPDTDDFIPTGSPNRYWNADIMILDTQTGQVKQITDTPADDVYASWSTDGRKLAFVSTRDGNNELYLMDPDGSNQRRLTHSDAQENAPVWLPNGYEILYRSNQGAKEGETRSQIHVVDIRTGTSRRVTTNEDMIYFSAELSPDGNRFIFSAFTVDIDAFRGERADIYQLKFNP